MTTSRLSYRLMEGVSLPDLTSITSGARQVILCSNPSKSINLPLYSYYHHPHLTTKATTTTASKQNSKVARIIYALRCRNLAIALPYRKP